MVTRIRKGARPHLYIKEHMDARDLSDERMADRLGVTRQTVFRWRKEQHRLDPEKIARLAAALDIEPEDLWRHPARPSLDALVKKAPDDLHATAVDIVKRLVRRGS
jgi:transcriptional regulator with XRE-family HTH domain